MCKEEDAFGIDREIDLRGVPLQKVASMSIDGLDGVKEGNYMLVYVDDYSYIAEIAKAVITKRAGVESVLRKGGNMWAVMVKNYVPVAQ